jgi:hypothetical protein
MVAVAVDTAAEGIAALGMSMWGYMYYCFQMNYCADG